MRGKRYSEEEIINVLKQSDAGIPIAEVCRTNGISSVTFYKWKSKFVGIEAKCGNLWRKICHKCDTKGKTRVKW